VARLDDADERARLGALDTLLNTYLPVLQWYVQRHPELDPHRREDLVQGFVASKVLRDQVLTRAQRPRGRFRTFLLSAFQNYVRDQLRRASAARRAPPGGLLPLDEADGASCETGNIDRHFHQAWLKQVVALAVKGMQDECTANGRGDVWSVFNSRLLAPMLEGADPEPYGKLVARLDLVSPSQASNILITAKRMFSRHLRAVIQDTVMDPAQVEEEFRELKNCL
jgi:RNA polymerase sigma-70 factor (ECF subfamily)